MTNPRLEGRVVRLKAQMAKITARLEQEPTSPKAAGWKRRWLECERSLVNLRDHGREKLGEAPAGAAIDVPARPFTIKAEG